MKQKYPKSSIKLGKVGAKFRRDVLKEYFFTDTHDHRRLELAAACLDRIDDCRKIIDKEGSFVFDRFKQRREHPACKTERDNKILFLRAVRELNLDIQDAPESRPPGLYK